MVSAVRPFRSPRQVEPGAGDREFAAVVANVPGAVYRCALDAEWTMAAISEEIERISGYPAADFIDSARRSFGSIIHPDDRAQVSRQVRSATNRDQPYGLEYRVIHADGAVRWVLERGQLVADAAGEPWLHGVIFDITARKRAEEELRERAVEHARIAELEAARARIIAAQDDARREIERNLHDGAQQRLVSLALTLRLLKGALERNTEVAVNLVDEAIENLDDATAELRELARGIHPAVLTDKGLSPAVFALADRAPIPVEVECSLEQRLPAGVEAAAYYAIAEALTNTARYAEATHATIRMGTTSDQLRVEVADDGIGGANSAKGSGLRGLTDRLDAVQGTIEVISGKHAGTLVAVRIPVPANHG